MGLRNSAKGFYVGLGLQGGFSKLNTYSENQRSVSVTEVDENGKIKYEYVNGDSIPKKSFDFRQFDISINSFWIAPMVTIGYQRILWEALYIDLYVGGGIKLNQTEKHGSTNLRTNEEFMDNSQSQFYNNPDIFSRYFKGVVPRVGLTLGIAL
jgi:hypothetical protein